MGADVHTEYAYLGTITQLSRIKKKNKERKKKVMKNMTQMIGFMFIEVI